MIIKVILALTVIICIVVVPVLRDRENKGDDTLLNTLLQLLFTIGGISCYVGAVIMLIQEMSV